MQLSEKNPFGTINLHAAQRISSLGGFVFPCHSGGEKAKSPLSGVRWRDASTREESQILDWWKTWPNAVPGIDLGKSDHIVIDCDVHGDADGVSAFYALCEENGWDITQSLIVQTPSGGCHVYFRQPAGEKLGNGTGKLPKGIDVRGRGGYVIAPGSVMETGHIYEMSGSDLLSLPEIPLWLTGMLRRERSAFPMGDTALQKKNARTGSYSDSAVNGEISRVAGAPRGERNNTLNTAAFSLGQIVGAGWADQAAIEERLLFAAQAVGLQADEARKTIQSGMRSGMAHPRKLLDDHPGIEEPQKEEPSPAVLASPTAAEAPFIGYPDGLVGDIARWTTENAIFSQPELSLLVGLAVVATVAGRQYCTPVKHGSLGLYTLGLAPTGSGKEAILQAGSSILAEAGLSGLIGASKFHSASAVFSFLLKQPLSICFMDEFGQWLKEINNPRSSSALAAVPGVLRSVWGVHFNSMRTPEGVSVASTIIEAPALSLFCVSTPRQFWDSINGKALEDGTLNRFLLLEGRSDGKRNYRESAPIPESVIHGLKNIYYACGELMASWRQDANQNPMKKKAIVALQWQADGSEITWQDFAETYQGKIRKEEEMARFYGRTAEIALRIASIITVGRQQGNKVCMEDLCYGMRLAEKSARLMDRGARDYLSENENQANAQKIIRVLRKLQGTATKTQLYRSLQNTVRHRDVKDLIQLLSDSGDIAVVTDTRKIRGRPTTVYKLIR